MLTLLRRRRILPVAAAAGAFLALVLTACGSSSSSGASNGTLTIGLLTPLSGPAGSYGPPERASVQTGVDKINREGGIKVGDQTYKLALKTYDTAYDPTKAATAARQAIDQDGIRYLEVLGGGIVPAVQPIAESSDAMIFATAAGDSFIGTDHPLTFRPYYDIPTSVEADLRYLKPKLPPDATVVSMYPNDDLGHPLAPESEKRIKALGMQSQVEYIDRDATDFTPVLGKVIDTADVIEFGPLPPSQYAVVVKQARQLGYQGYFVFPDTIDLPTVLKTASAADVAGSVTSPAWQNLKTPQGHYWEQQVTQKVGEVQGWTAQPYDNLFLLKDAMEKAGSIDTDAVAAELPKVSVNGALGQVRYGGASQYGIPRIFEIPYPVAEITADGKLKPVTEARISG